jgi:hypothetical protein
VRTTSVPVGTARRCRAAARGAGRPVFLDRDDRARFNQRPVVLLRLLPTLLGKLALGDVEHHALEQRVALVVASDRDRLVADPHLASVARPHPVFGAEGRLAVLARRPFGEDALDVVGVDQGRPSWGSPNSSAE